MEPLGGAREMGAAGGPAERFVRLWTRAQPRVASFIRTFITDPNRAEDLLQEVSVACLQKIEAYDPGRSFTAWCLGMARIEILRDRRESRRHGLLDHPEVLEAVARAQDDLGDELDSRTDALRQCVRLLSGTTRQMVELRYGDRRSLAAIADLRQVRLHSVTVMLSRARSWLRECIEKRLAHESA